MRLAMTNPVTHSCPLPIYAALGACGKAWVMPHNRRPKPATDRMDSREMRLYVTTYGSRGHATKDCEGRGQ